MTATNHEVIHSPDAERALLGLVLTTPELAPSLVDAVPAAAFYSPAHETIWQAVQALHAAGTSPDHLAVVAHLEQSKQLARVGGHNYLLDLRDAATWTATPEVAVEQIRQSASRRNAAAALHAAQQRLATNPDDPQAAIVQAMDALEVGLQQTWATPGEHDERQRQRDFDKKVRDRTLDLRIQKAAKAQLHAEELAGSDFSGVYLTRQQLLDLPAPEPLIEGVLPRHAYGILRGRDHTLKSFVAIDWACCLATGKAWQTRAVEPTRVLYIAGEGAHGLAARVAAWEYAWGHNVPDDMFVVRRTALNLHTPGPAFDDLLDRIRRDGFGLVVVDTLRRVSGTADANTSEMGAVVDNLDRIKHATDNGTVLAVAHTDKADHDTRGYSGIEDDADVVWATKRDDMFLTLELTKMKDGPDGTTIHLEATRTLNSLILTGMTGTPTPDTTASQLTILATMRDLFPDGTSGSELKDTCGLAKATYYRALGDLLKAGHLVNTGKGRQKFYELPALLTDTDSPADPPQEHVPMSTAQDTLEETANG